MRIPPGQSIPFWFRLWDGNPSRYVLAHLTDTSGVEQAGSPYPLTYSGNRGIYTGVGPAMGLTRLVADYQTYLDSGHTQLDNSYLPASDWLEPDVAPPPQLILLNTPLMGTIQQSSKISGTVACDVEAGGKINQQKLIGLISAPLLTGSVSAPEVENSL